MSKEKMVNPLQPFPNEMRGCYCEFTEKDKTRFIEINYIKYNYDEFCRLSKMNCLEESILGEYIQLIGENNIENNTSFLYKIQTYLGDISIKDAWNFNENISEYVQYGFSNFNDLINFCNKEWNLTIKDFMSIQDTHIP